MTCLFLTYDGATHEHCQMESYSAGSLNCVLGPSGTSALLCYVSMNDLDPLIKYTCHVFTES